MQSSDSKNIQLSLNKSDKDKCKNQLMEQLESINKWSSLSDLDKEDAIRIFMNSIGQLYMDYFQTHLDDAKACGKIYETKLKNAWMNISNSYVDEMSLRLRLQDEWADLWETACWARTNILSFNAMFGDFCENLTYEDIEEYMENRKGNAGLSRDLIPKNAPPSHWWWFEDYM